MRTFRRMKLSPLAAALSLFAAAPYGSAEEGCCASPVAPAPNTSSASTGTVRAMTTAQAPAGHPLRGVIVAVLAEKSALLVKHEEIPGVMSAMTMLLKVDAATLASAKKDQVITATLLKQPDGWWLRDVKADSSAK